MKKKRAATPPKTRAMSDADLSRARRTLMRRDKRLAAVMKQHGRCGLADFRTHEPFASLVRTIVSQQLSGKAAETIYRRVVALVGGRETLTPDAVLALDTAALRGAGLSGQKVTYVKDLAARVKSGALDLENLDQHDDEAVVTAITSVKGLGRWSAEMFLMFRLNRPDIFPIGDLGIVKGMQRLHGMKSRPAPKTMTRLAEPWRPYRSVAAWYLWRITE